MKTVATLVSLFSLMAVTALSSLEASAESSNYPGDLTKGKHLTIYVEGLADPSSGFFRVLNNGAQQAGKDLGVDVKYVYPASVDLASYTEKIEETIAAKPDGILILGIGDLDAVAKEAKDKGVAVAFNPAPSVKASRYATQMTFTFPVSAPTSTQRVKWRPIASPRRAQSR